MLDGLRIIILLDDADSVITHVIIEANLVPSPRFFSHLPYSGLSTRIPVDVCRSGVRKDQASRNLTRKFTELQVDDP